MRTPILTLAIPAFNMEKYLTRCLNSVLLPELEGSVEILLINDGSTDLTLSIAREYESKHPKMLNVINKENGGWGSAINIAIQQATGKYFKILDSDDWFNTVDYIQLVKSLKDTDVDIFASSFTEVFDDGETINKTYENELCDKIICFEEYLQSAKKKNLPMATLAIKTSILQHNGIQVLPGFYADIDYNLLPLLYVHTIQFSQLNVYQYLKVREGQSTSFVGYIRHIDDYIKLTYKVLSTWKEYAPKVSPIKSKLLYQEAVNISRFLFVLCLSSGNKNNELHKLQTLDNILKAEYVQIYKDLNKVITSKKIPYIWLWRKLHINIYKYNK